MQLDLLVTPVDAPWPVYAELARAAEQAGFSTLWCLDHLSGATFDAGTIAECFTLLAALAASTQHLRLGPLVANATLRLPALLANSAATLQLISGGRLALGLGAGASASTSASSTFGSELAAAGVAASTIEQRHALVAATLDALDNLWAPPGSRGPHLRGFPRAEPRPEVVLGVHSTALAALAGARADGVNAWSTHPRLGQLFEVARAAAADAGRPAPNCSVWAPYDRAWLDPGGSVRAPFVALGVERVMLGVRPGTAMVDELRSVSVVRR